MLVETQLKEALVETKTICTLGEARSQQAVLLKLVCLTPRRNYPLGGLVLVYGRW